MPTGVLAIIIIAIIIIGAIATRRCTEFLLLGSILGAFILYGIRGLPEWILVVQDSVADNAWLWLVCGNESQIASKTLPSFAAFCYRYVVSQPIG